MTQPALEHALPRIRGLIGDALRRYGIPGAAAGIVLDGNLAWSEGFGFTDLEHRRQPDHRTLFRVASITKTFTGTAIMQLRDAGKLRLDDPIADYIPEFRKVRARRGSLEQVTLRRLLTHHSGLISEAPYNYWDTLEFPHLDKILGSLPQVEVVLNPDTAFKYSNLAFALLGEVVSRVSGQPYEAYVTGRILRPLGLNTTTFALDDEGQARFASGYDADPHADSPAQAKHCPLRGLTAAGGLYSCVEDLARWIAFQLRAYPANDSSSSSLPLRPTTLAEMHRPQILEPDWTVGYCLPWRAARSGNRIYLNHGGGLPGHRTTVHFDPVRGSGFIFLTNLGWHNAPEEVAVPALDALADAMSASQAVQMPDLAPAPAEFKKLLGAYVAVSVLFVNIEWRHAQLHLVLPPGVRSLHAPARLRPTDDPLAFEVVGGRGAGELARFELDHTGAVTSFALGGAVYRRLSSM